MIGLLSILVLFVLFYRELLFLLVLTITGARKIEPGPWDIILQARLKRSPTIYIHSAGLIETLSIQTFWQSAIFVSEPLWNELSNEERECLLGWFVSAHLRASVIERLLFVPKLQALDRDIAFLSSQPLCMVDLLKKTIHQRASQKLSPLGNWLSGLSFLGPSFFSDWPTNDERLRHIASSLADLN